MADKDIDPVSGNHISPYMQDITGMFMLLAGKTDWMFRVSLIAKLVPLVKKCYINPVSYTHLTLPTSDLV